MALWGNQSDLSLFANASEVQQAQSQMAACDEHTVVNDLDAVVDYISTLQNGESIVFVLDNSGTILLSSEIHYELLNHVMTKRL